MSRAFFDHVADALVGFLPPALRAFRSFRTARNLKVWFGDESREHYEAQVIPASALRGSGIKASGAVLELGFHAEHADAALNQAVLDAIVSRERTWRRKLGDEPGAGRFLGRQSAWRRLSEVWDGPLDGSEAATEAAARLADYIRAIQPLRERPPATTPTRRRR